MAKILFAVTKILLIEGYFKKPFCCSSFLYSWIKTRNIFVHFSKQKKKEKKNMHTNKCY